MTVTLLQGDCIEVMRGLDAASVDSCVTDPPYHLASIVKRFGAADAAPAKVGKTGAYKRASRGFMGKKWDGGDIAFRPETWAEVLRVLKPGGHVLAFGSSKGYHRMACAIEDAGFEIRDTIMWLYGTGFPKSHNLDGEWDGWGTALKPAFEPVIMARKPLIGTVEKNVLTHGTGAINIDASRVPAEGRPLRVGDYKATADNVYEGRQDGSLMGGSKAVGSTDQGRFPANVIHDGSDEVEAGFPNAPGQLGRSSTNPETSKTRDIYGAMGHATEAMEPRGDSGSASRFFYCAKATKAERAGSKHPTVKPIALMRYLCRLVTPPGGMVLDPFAGTGTTGQAAIEEGFRVTLIEREDEYANDIRNRLGLQLSAEEMLA